MNREGSSKSFFSMVSKTNMSSKRSYADDEVDEEAEGQDLGDSDDNEKDEKITNPIIQNLSTMFSELNSDIKDLSKREMKKIINLI